jgi:hypothetical protein
VIPSEEDNNVCNILKSMYDTTNPEPDKVGESKVCELWVIQHMSLDTYFENGSKCRHGPVTMRLVLLNLSGDHLGWFSRSNGSTDGTVLD